MEADGAGGKDVDQSTVDNLISAITAARATSFVEGAAKTGWTSRNFQSHSRRMRASVSRRSVLLSGAGHGASRDGEPGAASRRRHDRQHRQVARRHQVEPPAIRGSRAADNTDNTDQTETFTTHRPTTTTRILTRSRPRGSLSRSRLAARQRRLLLLPLVPHSDFLSQAPKASAAVARLRADLTLVFTAPIMARGVWGVDIRSLDTGEPLFELNSGRLMMPASNMKILTLAAAADALGWDYVFTTTLETSAPVTDGVLMGDLIVRGGGDPTINRATSAPLPSSMNGWRRCDRPAFRRSTAE